MTEPGAEIVPTTSLMTRGNQRDAIIAAVAAKHRVKVSEILSLSKQRHVSYARFEIMHRLRYELGLSCSRVGVILKRDHSTVSFGIQRHKEIVAAGGGVVSPARKRRPPRPRVWRDWLDVRSGCA